MAIALENAGANRGCLLLARAGQWVIEASGTVEVGVQVLQSLELEALAEPVEWPVGLIRYVIRTQQTVVLFPL